ncbi:MAG: hypothetical protein C5B50_15570 [Verrucomicrobia bacterium]|nr:MAG: hypothetical protein C5B50_15570 [Verrucomicrobiota bacterium]
MRESLIFGVLLKSKPSNERKTSQIMKMIKRLNLLALFAALAIGTPTLRADDAPKATDSQKDAKKDAEAKPFPAAKCLISGESLTSMGKPYVMVYEGQELKFCCKDCVKDFSKDKTAYMKKLEEAEAKATPYPMKKCVVSGEAFGQEKPYVFAYEGQQVKLCCKDCLKDFKKDPAKYMKKIEVASKAEK